MTVYVVYDEAGSGRIVGVFESETDALEILKVNPNYYRISKCELNKISTEAMAWLGQAQKQQLDKFGKL
jgi:hypothetical protein